MGDVVSIRSGRESDHPPLPQRSLSEPSGSDLILDDDQVGDFIGLVSDLDQAGDTRVNQLETMRRIRSAVSAWPDG